MESVACDFCKQERSEPFIASVDFFNNIKGVFTAVRCIECNLIYTDPRPSKNEIHKYYPNSYEHYEMDERDDKPPKYMQGMYLNFLRDYFGYEEKEKESYFTKLLLVPIYFFKRNKLYTNGIPHYVKNGKLLEIGCSHGKFLSDLKQLGWDVTGVEFSNRVAKSATERYGLEIINKDIDEVEFGANSFDVIIMKMVLEHVSSPDSMLRRISQWLKPGGQLIISIPNISGVEARLFTKYFHGLHLPNHFYHFTPETIKKYFERHNIAIKKIHYMKDTTNFKRSVEFFRRANPSSVIGKILDSSFFKLIRKPLLMTIFLFHHSSKMIVYGTRK